MRISDWSSDVCSSDLALDRLRLRLDRLDDLVDCKVDAALQVHRVHAGGNRLHAFAHDRLGEHGRGGGAVAGLVVRLRCDFAQHLGAHVFELRSEEHTSELQSLMRISYAVFCLKKKTPMIYIESLISTSHSYL